MQQSNCSAVTVPLRLDRGVPLLKVEERGSSPTEAQLAGAHLLCLHSAALSAHIVHYLHVYCILWPQDTALQEEASSLLALLLSAPPESLEGMHGVTWRSSAILAVSRLSVFRARLSEPGPGAAAVARGVARCGTALAEVTIDDTRSRL